MTNGSSLRVLLAEDSSLLAARLTELIGHLPDIELIGTVDCEADTLSHVAADTPDVLILDLHLRSGSGFGVLRALARGSRRPIDSRRPKIVILTNFGLPEYRREAEAFGVEAFLDKSRDYFRLPSLLTDFARDRSAQPH
jgi:two-component system, OmpR family, response regulator